MYYYKTNKIESGLYEYRGWVIEEMKQRAEHPQTMWNVSEIRENNIYVTYDCNDSTNTLKEAKRIIDYYIEKNITNK